MTNCEDYRQMIAADPAFDGGAGHLSGCRECQAFRADMQSLNEKISRALEINAPELQTPSLPAIEQDHVVALPVRRTLPRPAWYALAASVMLAVVVGARFLVIGIDPAAALAEEVLAHVDHEPAALKVTNVAVPDGRLEQVVPASIARLNHSAGLITYAQSCIINGHTVPHLVMQGEHGPITVLLMPEEPLAKAVVLDGENIHGVILPIGDGSIAIIGARAEKLERVEESVLNSVTWGT